MFLFVISGSVVVMGQPVAERESLGIQDTDKVSIECTAGACFLLMEAPIHH